MNGEWSSWDHITTGVPPRFYSWINPFLIYINDFSNGQYSKPKFFVGDISLFSAVLDSNKSVKDPNDDLKIYNWSYYRKIIFNLDPFKQVQELIFRQKNQ